MRTRKRRETSKLILWCSWAAALTLTGLVAVCTFLMLDTSGLVALAGLAWGELTVAHGFYFWKAKNENRAKGSCQLVRHLAEKYGIDAAARFAELIFKD